MNAIARASVTIASTNGAVWSALLNPEAIKQYMFGAIVRTDWVKGSPISWKGEWKGKPYEDKGVVLEIEPGRELRYSHFSPLAGLPDKPENYHEVKIELSGVGASTTVSLAQDGNATDEARAHSAKNWMSMLEGLKKFVER
jgi:uncharacterized protein YndB with AHSA1/START domain